MLTAVAFAGEGFDEGVYPRDDIKALLAADGRWQFTHKDGRPY